MPINDDILTVRVANEATDYPQVEGAAEVDIPAVEKAPTEDPNDESAENFSESISTSTFEFISLDIIRRGDFLHVDDFNMMGIKYGVFLPPMPFEDEIREMFKFKF